MKKIKFEYKITFAYLVIGGLWISFSDKFLSSIITDITLLTRLQTYKGWFYVIVTGILFFLYIKNHLSKLRNTENELEKHKNHLEKMVQEKTNDLETLNEELRTTNDELYHKNEIINNQNTELKFTLNHLKDTQTQLLQSEKMASLGVLTAGIAHEINNPLNYIMGSYMGLLRHYENNSFAEDYTQVGVLLDSLKVGVDRAVAIIEGLNQFSRSSKSYNEECNIHSIITNSLSILQSQLKHRITVVTQFSQPDIIIHGNVGNLHQVCINIFSNAIQSILDKGTITISTKLVDSHVCIEVSDTGEGIKPENLQKITEPFFTTKDPGKGTGLGLAITYNIIKKHKGQLLFESELGKGTTVKIMLPAH